MELKNLCLGCMHELSPSAEVCPNCSKWVGEPQPAPLLPKKYVLEGRYFIGFSVASSTDCVTYCALDLQSGRRVSVCEFLPKNLIVRNDGETIVKVRTGYDSMYNACLQSFIRLWKTLFSLNNEPALPRVKEIFSANSTVYAVYETVEFITLEAYLSAEKRVFGWERVKTVFKPVLSALLALEKKGIVHAAVSPLTVLVGADGKLHLSGFSIPQTRSDVIELRAPSSAGYSPLELSDRRLYVGTYTDVYSAAAVMYTMLTGLTPQIAADRAVNDLMVIPNECAKNLQKSTIEIILGALRVYPERRIQSVEKLYFLLYPAGDKTTAAEKVSVSNGKREAESGSSKADKPRQNAPSKEKPEEKTAADEKKPPLPESVKEETKSAVTFKAIVAALVIAAMVFVTAYSTLLYRYFDVPFLDKALSAMTFLPLNGETKPTQKPSESTEPPSSTSAETVTVADFSQLTYRDIQNNETFNRNFKIEFSFEPSNEVEKNSIISQSIPAGKHVAKGTVINIVVSTGKPYIVLRDVMGMKYEDAYELLTKDGFVVQKVIRENDGTRTPGTVYTMSLVAGLEFEKGTTVTLSVWGD